LQEAGLLALPVTDPGGTAWSGVYTVDDAMEVLRAEETEDITRAGGAEPLNVSYLCGIRDPTWPGPALRGSWSSS
jgi:magnesium transporter